MIECSNDQSKTFAKAKAKLFIFPDLSLSLRCFSGNDKRKIMRTGSSFSKRVSILKRNTSLDVLSASHETTERVTSPLGNVTTRARTKRKCLSEASQKEVGADWSTRCVEM